MSSHPPLSASSSTEICLSLIIPIYNESPMIEPLMARLVPVIAQLNVSTEIIFVDDGSCDDSWQALSSLSPHQCEHQCIKLSRNFGKEAAMSAGLMQARGLAVILLDADLQDPPELIPQMMSAWQQGFDVVNMKRRKRLGETWFKRFSAASFYRLINWMSDSPVPENVGDFRLMSRQVVDCINTLPERNRFMKGIFSWPGFSQQTLEFDRDPRFCGETKWNYTKLLGLAMDGITSFSFKPLRIATWCGVITALFAFGYGSWVVTKTLVYGDTVAGYPSLMVVQLTFAGMQLLALGLIGEYLGRVFVEVKQRPIYLIETINHQASSKHGQASTQTSQATEASAAKSNISYLG
ncbi:glycosyltransferase family 2 protein [Shewanella sp. SR44-3]|uniref:glycosyltransferase family 2 protein n=1 Tax=Shewanella sp. SR44-3 TaxID=2760936 RepID=UPI0015F878BA|nr:glycosyltransferase family 2 protein [Shewanella sp. SR44-3]MBB1271125.1 glycosyltransferase family 2 protein [Shewanella sp. SR44-3]